MILIVSSQLMPCHDFPLCLSEWMNITKGISECYCFHRHHLLTHATYHLITTFSTHADILRHRSALRSGKWAWNTLLTPDISNCDLVPLKRLFLSGLAIKSHYIYVSKNKKALFVYDIITLLVVLHKESHNNGLSSTSRSWVLDDWLVDKGFQNFIYAFNWNIHYISQDN